MRNHRTASALTGLLLLILAGTTTAGEAMRDARSPHRQTRDMTERLYDRAGRHEHGGRNGRGDWQQARRGRDGHSHEDSWHHDRERDSHWGHEHWRENTDRHSWQGRGYWPDYHHGYHRGYGYRHRYYNNSPYYYNASGFYFPGYGFIERGHVHGGYCPHWHFDDFAAGFVLGAIIND